MPHIWLDCQSEESILHLLEKIGLHLHLLPELCLLPHIPDEKGILPFEYKYHAETLHQPG